MKYTYFNCVMDSLLSIVKLYNVCCCILFDYFRRFRLNLLHLDAKLTVLPPTGRLLETAQLKLMTLPFGEAVCEAD